MTFAQYLAAKKSIDDRSLNWGVWSRLDELLPEATDTAPTRVFEAGCGIGTMVERCLERGLLGNAQYTPIDKDGQLVGLARERLENWGLAHRCTVEHVPDGGITLTFSNGSRTRVNFIVGDALEYARDRRDGNSWDLVLAHAFLDLANLDIIPALLGTLAPQGLFYFSLNFDGLTAFLPEIDPNFDRQVVKLYHRSMDERRVGGVCTGGSRSGRKIISRLLAEKARIIQAGASDWVITPHGGEYTPDEVVTLQAILQMVHDELVGHPQLDRSKFLEWVRAREDQIKRGELSFIAHQLDVLGRA